MDFYFCSVETLSSSSHKIETLTFTSKQILFISTHRQIVLNSSTCIIKMREPLSNMFTPTTFSLPLFVHYSHRKYRHHNFGHRRLESAVRRTNHHRHIVTTFSSAFFTMLHSTPSILIHHVVPSTNNITIPSSTALP